MSVVSNRTRNFPDTEYLLSSVILMRCRRRLCLS